MCLYTITKEYSPNNKIKYGYKLFYKDSNNSQLVHNMYRMGCYDLNRQYEADVTFEFTRHIEKYTTGFHYYPRKKDAIIDLNDTLDEKYLYAPHINYKIYKVKIQDIRYEGTERLIINKKK